MTGATLYIAVEFDSVSAAQNMLRHFIEAGLKDDDPRVHVAIGDADTRHDEPGTRT